MLGASTRILATYVVMLSWLIGATFAAARADTVVFAGTPWEQVARREGLAPALLYALALTRSGRITAEGTAAPWPWTIRSDGRSRQFASLAQAQEALARLHQHATIEVGLVGIPVDRRRPEAAAELLDPATNLRLAAAALAERLRAQSQAPALAIGRWVYPQDPDAARTLGRRVLAIAASLNGTGPSRGLVTSRQEPDLGSAAAATAPVARLIRAAAARHGVDPAFALAIAQVESGFDQAAVSPQRACGVMQLMPATAARYGADPRNLDQNIEAGVRYLRDLAELFDGDPALVAAGYNAGEHAVLRHQGRIPPYPETQRYVPRVLAARERYR